MCLREYTDELIEILEKNKGCFRWTMKTMSI
jgi:hypothetical protein